MKRKFVYFLIISILLIITLSCKNKNSKDKIKKSQLKYKILKHQKKKRIFFKNSLQLKKEIKFNSLKEEIYFPIGIRVQSLRSIYIFDGKAYKLHKLSLNEDFSKIKQTVFSGKSIRGKGPGEVSRLLDFKIYKNRIYLLDGGTNSLIIYSENGSLVKTLKVKNNRGLVFMKFTFFNDVPLLCVYGMGDLFYLINYKGEVLKSFGGYIDKRYSENILYHQYSVSLPFHKKYFYYLPLYLGFVGIYENEKLKFVKETIGGERFPEFIQEEINGAIVTKMKGLGFRTASKYALGENFVVIKSIDMEKKIAYWDFYTIDSFDYLFSIKNPPLSYDFDAKKDYIVSVNEEGVKIFKIVMPRM